MGKNRKRGNPFAARKRARRENNQENNRSQQTTVPYPDIVRDNEAFVKFYKAQEQLWKNDEEWDAFLKSVRSNLPVSFRVTGFKEEAKALLNVIKTDFFSQYAVAMSELNEVAKEDVEPPLELPWYPEGLAYQLDLSKKDIRRSEVLYRLHNFLIVETSVGAISRQETVSMIPPIVLQVKPTDKVLDMCAAPGSKTAQIIEDLHAESSQYKLPPGFVIANDLDNKRCYMLVHQAKRLNSPCFAVTNHDSRHFPDLLQTQSDGTKTNLKFDKILCDVPCSGDGTIRKCPDIWLKWNMGQGYNLHGLQYNIVKRGAELLRVGGRLVYSTCSLNPVENEAVLQRLLKDTQGALEIVDASDLLPGLKYKPGLTSWVLASKDVDEVFTAYEQVPQKYHTIILPHMFPQPKEDLEKFGITKCMRILPHLQNTGAFFVAVLEKKAKLPSELEREAKAAELAQKDQEKADLKKSEATSDEKRVPWGPQRKRRHIGGYKEDPYVFFSETDKDFDEIRDFYELDASFKRVCLLTRCISEKKRNVYYCSEAIRDLLLLNQDSIKFINTGLKAFVRCENRHAKTAFRLAQEGLLATIPFIGKKRHIAVKRDDLINLLKCTNPQEPLPVSQLTEETLKQYKGLDFGSCVLVYSEPKLTLYIVGWCGPGGLRAYVDKVETIHILRLIGADVSEYEVNKYEKARELASANGEEEEVNEEGEVKDEKLDEQLEENANEEPDDDCIKRKNAADSSEIECNLSKVNIETS